MSGPHQRRSPYPGYPPSLQAEIEALSAEGNELLEAAAGLTPEEFDALLERLVARAQELWGRAGWTELEQQSSALGMRASMKLLFGTLGDGQAGRSRGG